MMSRLLCRFLVIGSLLAASSASQAFLNQGRLPPFAGAEDTTFFGSNGRDAAVSDHGFDATVRAIVYHPGSNSLIVGGDFTKYNGVFVNGLAKISLDGQLDTTFNANIGAGFTGSVYTIAVDNNNRIVVGGTFVNAGGYSNLDYIARLQPDGSYDSFFQPDAIAGEIKSIAIDGSNRIVIGCNCHDDVPLPYNYQLLARLRASDGKFDSTFAQTALTYDGSASVNSVALTSDGSIVAGGSFVISGTKNNVMKFQTNGNVDNSFLVNIGTATTASSFVYAVRVQADDKILVGGTFTTFDGFAAPKLVRLQANGIRDTGFALSSQLGTVYGIFLDSAAKLLVVGTQFGNVGSNPGYQQIRRYGTAGGATDLSLNPGAGFGPLASNIVYSMAYHKGYLYAVGDFSSYNAHNVPRITKIYVGPYDP